MRLLLVHGMGRTTLSMMRLSRFLRRFGHDVDQVGYVAAIESFDHIQRRVRRRLEGFARDEVPYAVIGHSLGGLALRAALDGLEPAPAHFIMLGTPNQAPRLARRFSRLWAYRLLCGESGQLLARDEFFATLPHLAVPHTMVAGTAGRCGRLSLFGQDANDWVVAVDETRMRPADQPVVLPVGHTFMMNDRRVQAVIQRALASAAVGSQTAEPAAELFSASR